MKLVPATGKSFYLQPHGWGTIPAAGFNFRYFYDSKLKRGEFQDGGGKLLEICHIGYQEIVMKCKAAECFYLEIHAEEEDGEEAKLYWHTDEGDLIQESRLTEDALIKWVVGDLRDEMISLNEVEESEDPQKSSTFEERLSHPDYRTYISNCVKFGTTNEDCIWQIHVPSGSSAWYTPRGKFLMNSTLKEASLKNTGRRYDGRKD
jgi:hypothetical protein